MSRPLPVTLGDSAGTEFTSSNPVPVNSYGPANLTISAGYNFNIAASASLADALSAALPSDVTAATISNNSTNVVYLQFDGTEADTNAFPLQASQSITVYGVKAVLDNIEIYAASSSNVGLLLHE